MGEVENKKLVVIDGKSVFYRGYYAMPNLSTKDGTPTGGVYGFAVMALEVIKRLKPDYVCVAWDKPKTNIRKRLELYPEYKAGRKPAPPDFYDQIPILHELLDAFGWPLYELDDYEADDIMGTLSVKAKEGGIDTLLVTSDLDLLQVINGNVHVYALKKGLSNIELFHPESFEEKYGISVEQFLDLKALKGDSSDNIPGVPGVGEKGAIELLKQFKTLDGVYENLEEIKESTRKKLVDGKDLAYLSKKIAAIWTDAPIELELNELDVSNCEPEKVRDILQKLEFRTLVRQLPEVMQVQEEHMHHVSTDLLLPKNILIDDDKKLKEIDPDNFAEIILHSYSAGKHGKDPKVLLISPDPKTLFTIILDKVDHKKIIGALGEQLNHEAIRKIGYDIKSTIKVCYELGAKFSGVDHDVQVGAFLINSLRREQTLTELANTDLGYEGSEFENLSPDEFIDKAPEIIAVIRGLYEQQAGELEKIPKLHELAQTIEWPVIPVLASMEYEGIGLDTAYLNRMSEELADQISDVEQEIYGYADQEFNISSPAQLADVLFNSLGLPTTGIKKGKTGYSTAANELDKLRGQHPIIDLITEYREYTKLKNTYVDTLPNVVDENSRVHTTFSLTVAPTGRLSSNDPNLQNIPVRSELGKTIRTAFVPGDGNVFVSADYSQFELRLAAYLANDEELIDMFNRDVDIHTATASQVYGRDPEDVTKNMRRDAKVINFGILYGMSPHGLSIATGMTLHQAKEFIDKYFELRKPILEYMEKLKEKAKNDGFVETLFGRRRPTPDVHSSNFVVRQAAERAAINMPIQGTEADLMKMAMVAVQNELDDDCKQLLQIHDSILVQCPESKAKDVAKLLKEIMENIHKLPVKLTVDTSMGKNWGEL
ncbi:DNA polymerase I [Candidatus Saccharibacteria bacterium]|nr:DNA polymerase I [Candidatus Saccharibacteria bacterium]